MGDLLNFKDKPEYLGGLLIALGFLASWFFSNWAAYALVILGLASCTVSIWKKPIVGVYLTIFFLPLTKTVSLPVVGTKLAVPEILFLLTFITYIFKRELDFDRIKQRFENSYYLIPLALFLVFSVVSVINAVSLQRWLVEVATYFYLAIFFLFMIYAIDSDEKIRMAVKTLVYSISAVIVIGVIGYLLFVFGLHDNPLMEFGRVTSTFKAVNQLSISLLVGFFLLILKSDSEKGLSRAAWVSICFLGILAFLASGTRMVPIVLVPSLIAYAIIRFAFIDRKISRVGVALLALTITLLFVPLNFPETKPLERSAKSVKEISHAFGESFNSKTTTSENEEGVVEVKEAEKDFLDFVKRVDSSRYHQLMAFLQLFPKHPFIGVGAGNFQENMQDYSDSPHALEMHNTFLGVLVEEGLLGFLSLLVFLAWLFFKGIKAAGSYARKNYLLMLLLGLAAHFMYTMVQFGLRNRHLWLGLALLCCMVKDYEDDV